MNSILLLEDDPDLSHSLIKYLQKNGYCVTWAKTGEEVIDLTFAQTYDLYLFDINVPLLSGTDLLKQLRDAGDITPTIIISALVDVASVTEGFTAGADDYLKKPFDPDELLVRIRAKTKIIQSRSRFGDIEIDIEEGVVLRSGMPLVLGDVYTRLLMTLVRHYPNPVPKDRLLEQLDKPTDLALRVNISRLKKELGITIKAVRGVGYQIL